MDFLWQYLVQGDFIGFFLALWRHSFGGLYDLFPAIVLLLFAVPLYIRTQSVTYLLILWILCSPFLIAAMPVGIGKIVGVLLTTAFAGILYTLFSKRFT